VHNYGRELNKDDREAHKYGREMDKYGREADKDSREVQKYGREADKFDRGFNKYGREIICGIRLMKKGVRQMDVDGAAGLVAGRMRRPPRRASAVGYTGRSRGKMQRRLRKYLPPPGS
jgi:hypothetical protein